MKNFFYLGLVFLLSFCQIKESADQQKADVEQFSFAFLTDIHLQPELDATEGFQRAINSVNELKPDFVITGGDLIMDALGVSYNRAASLYDLYLETIGNFKMPVYNTLGNHEIYGLYENSHSDTTNEEYGKKMYEKRIGNRYYSFDHEEWHFMILDAVGISSGREYKGYIDDEQITWIKSDLANIDKQTPIVISVHIPFITSRTQLTQGSQASNGDGTVITNATDVLKLFLPYNLKLVLQGHLHFLEDIYVDNKVHFITGGAVSGRWWKGPPSENVAEGFLLIRAQDNKIEWEYIDYGWEAVQE